MTKSLTRKFRSHMPATDIAIARRYLGLFCPQDTALDVDAPTEPEDRTYTPANFVHIVSDQRPLITPLSLLLLLVRMLRPAGCLPLPQPPGLTRITCWDDHCAANMMALLKLHPVGVARSPWRVAAVQATRQPDRETDQDATLRQVRTLIEAGKHVVLLSHSDEPPHPALARLCPQALTLPRPDRRLIMDLFTVLHDAKAVPDVVALPPDAALSQLQTMELEIAFRQPAPAQTLDCLHRFTAPQGPNPAGGAAAPVLDQVRGQPEALTALKQIADDTARWASGQLDWHEVPRSVLLYGPPGTGKTMLARALAGSTGLPLIVTSYAECQGSGEGHMGHIGKRTHHSQASLQSPVLIEGSAR